MPGKGAVCWPIQRITRRWPSQGNSMKSMGTPFVQRHLISDIMNKILVRKYFLHQISQMRTFHVDYYKYLRLFDKKIFFILISHMCTFDIWYHKYEYFIGKYFYIWYHKWSHLISDITNKSLFYKEIYLHQISQMRNLVSDIRNKTSNKKNHC